MTGGVSCCATTCASTLQYLMVSYANSGRGVFVRGTPTRCSCATTASHATFFSLARAFLDSCLSVSPILRTAVPRTDGLRGRCLAGEAASRGRARCPRRRGRTVTSQRERHPRGGESSGGPRGRVVGGSSAGAGAGEARRPGGRGCEYERRDGGAAATAR